MKVEYLVSFLIIVIMACVGDAFLDCLGTDGILVRTLFWYGCR